MNTTEVFRRALIEEEDPIFSLYAEVKEKGRKDGTSDWDEDYPNLEILHEDLVNDRVFVLVIDNKIISSISIYENEIDEVQVLDWTNVKACFLVRLCVSPKYQGKKIGEIMMKNISEYARKKGFKATQHLAAEVNIAANRLYKRMGYRNVGKINLYETEFNAYEMLL